MRRGLAARQLLRLLALILACTVAASVVGTPMPADRVTAEEAGAAASGWIEMVIAAVGDWGGATRAWVDGCTELRRGELLLGYFCPIRPRGYIVVSPYETLAPAKFYSTTVRHDLESEVGMGGLIKDVLEREVTTLEAHVASLRATGSEAGELGLAIDHHDTWDQLLGGGGPDAANYQEGNTLLTSSWNQDPPYNAQCPAMSCTWGGCATNNRAYAGCGAIAGGQIARYWNWPPYGVGTPYSDTYDWPNMPDSLAYCGAGEAPAAIDAVAELCYEIGLAADSTYGCGGTGSTLLNMRNALVDHYRYDSSAVRLSRSSYGDIAWFNLIKGQLNINRPVDYEVPQHFIVVDGWRELGPTPTRQLHVIYGWGGTNDDWYTIDTIPGTDWANWPHEKIISNVVPAQAIGSSVSGTYTKQTFNYRYFDRDVTGGGVFSAGQFVQFLPGVVVTSTGTIQFNGTSGDNTRLFTRGNTGTGIRIYGGAVRLNNGGEIRLP